MMIKSINVVALVLASLLGAASWLAVAAASSYIEFSPTPVELPSHRLPTNVRPFHYQLDLDLTPTPRSKWFSYRGAVNISVDFMGPDNSKIARCFNKLTNHAFAIKKDGASAETTCLPRPGKKNQIVLHADESISIKSVRVFKFTLEGETGGKQELRQLKIAKQGRDAAKQLIVLDLASELPRVGSRGLLEFIFETKFRDDKHGIYKSFKSSRMRGAMTFFGMVAKFQPTFARLALPCFDEPSFKARFSLSITHENGYQAFANTELAESAFTMGIGRVSKFKTTPPMSIHMLAFTVGDYDEPLELRVRDNLLLRAITPKGKRLAGAYALEVAKFSIEHFEKYIDYEFPLEKMDIVAIPDMDTENTETWGLTFVRENSMLIDEETKEDSKITTAVNVAHVCVHTWFANLITAVWWDDMWITESVAAHMAYELVAQLFPNQSDYFVRISTLSAIIASDSSGKNHSLAPNPSELTTSDKVYELFDNIQFQKSCAVSRLLQNTLGREKYRAILQELVRRHAYGSVTLNNLLSAISAQQPADASRELERVINSWTTLRSYPVINVALSNHGNKLVLYQQTFSSTSFNVKQNYRPHDLWTLPLSVLIGDATGEHGTLIETVQQGRVNLPPWFVIGRDWVKVSPKPDLSTYYRVRYSSDLLETLRAPVERRQLDAMERLHLLDDARALGTVNKIWPEKLNDILSWHSEETDPAVLIEMLITSKTLSGILPANKPLTPIAGKAFVNLFKQHGFQVNGNETLLEQRARMVVLRALVAQGVQEVIEAGAKVFQDTKGQVALFLREPVYAAVVATGNDDQVQKLLSLLKRTRSHEEKIRLANALALSQDMHVLSELCTWLFVSDLKKEELAPIEELINQSRRKSFYIQNRIS